jgi:hypothetical protein
MDSWSYRSVNRLPKRYTRSVQWLPDHHTGGTQTTMKEQCPDATWHCMSILLEYTTVALATRYLHC